MLGRLAERNLLRHRGEQHLQVYWDSVSVADLQAMVPDDLNHLTSFMQARTAGDVSRSVFGRPDCAIFVSLFACLWHDTIERFDFETIKAGIASGVLTVDTVTTLARTIGVTPAPREWAVACLDMQVDG